MQLLDSEYFDLYILNAEKLQRVQIAYVSVWVWSNK